MKKILALILVLVTMLTAVACNGKVTVDDSSDKTRQSDKGDKDNKSSGDDDKSSNKDNDKDEYKDSEDWIDVDESVYVDDLEYAIHSYILDDHDEGDLPAEDGYTYLLVYMTIYNETEEDASVSSLLNFELEDDDGTIYDLSFSGLLCMEEYDIEQADGTIPSSSYFTCGVAFEVPQDATGLKLKVLSYLTDDSSDVLLME